MIFYAVQTKESQPYMGGGEMLGGIRFPLSHQT